MSTGVSAFCAFAKFVLPTETSVITTILRHNLDPQGRVTASNCCQPDTEMKKSV